MKMKCDYNSSDCVGEFGNMIVDGRKQHEYLRVNNQPQQLMTVILKGMLQNTSRLDWGSRKGELVYLCSVVV